MNIERICMDERQLRELPVSALCWERAGYDCVLDGEETSFMSALRPSAETLEDYGVDLQEGEVLIVTLSGRKVLRLEDRLTIITRYRQSIPDAATPKEQP